MSAAALAHRPWIRLPRRGGSRPSPRARALEDHRPRIRLPRRGGSRPSPRARALEECSSRAPAPALVLIGGRGCGKSALCRRLVAADGRFTLYSLDDMIVEEAGMSIPDIVDARGWAWFRDLEYDVCVKAARLAREDTSGWTLIDAGGGVVVDLDENGNETYSRRKIETLRGERNVIVYLKRDVAYLLNRTSGDKNRPSLSDDVSFQTLMERRAPWYFRAADYIVDASGGAVESAVKSKREIKEEVLEFYYAETGEEPPGPGAGAGARSR